MSRFAIRGAISGGVAGAAFMASPAVAIPFFGAAEAGRFFANRSIRNRAQQAAGAIRQGTGVRARQVDSNLARFLTGAR